MRIRRETIRLLSLLIGKDLTAREVANHFEYSVVNAERRCEALANAGLVDRTERGYIATSNGIRACDQYMQRRDSSDRVQQKPKPKVPNSVFQLAETL